MSLVLFASIRSSSVLCVALLSFLSFTFFLLFVFSHLVASQIHFSRVWFPHVEIRETKTASRVRNEKTGFDDDSLKYADDCHMEFRTRAFIKLYRYLLFTLSNEVPGVRARARRAPVLPWNFTPCRATCSREFECYRTKMKNRKQKRKKFDTLANISKRGMIWFHCAKNADVALISTQRCDRTPDDVRYYLTLLVIIS